MAVRVRDHGIILEPTKLPFESWGVFNPACIEMDGIVHMFYRAVRPGNHSSIGYCQLRENKVIFRLNRPLLAPEYEYEQQGMEDPRIILLNDTYYLLYTAFDGTNARGAYATSADLITFTKQGLITPRLSYKATLALLESNPDVAVSYRDHARTIIKNMGPRVELWDKDLFMFPKKINDLFWLGHRIMPSIQLASFQQFSDLSPAYWQNYLKNLNHWTLLSPGYSFESHHIGGGCPPLETEEGWLLIYHAVEETNGVLIYSAGAALLDLKNPQKVIGCLPYPLFTPATTWEVKGNIDGVIFPTGALIRDDEIFIYYGSADTCIGLKSLCLSELLAELQKNPPAS